MEINGSEPIIKQIQNLTFTYKNAQSYMEDNYEKLTTEQVRDIQKEQEVRRKEIEKLSKTAYFLRNE